MEKLNIKFGKLIKLETNDEGNMIRHIDGKYSLDGKNWKKCLIIGSDLFYEEE